MRVLSKFNDFVPIDHCRLPVPSLTETWLADVMLLWANSQEFTVDTANTVDNSLAQKFVLCSPLYSFNGYAQQFTW
jgi:FMN-dependent NADH-azoreductase